MIENTSNPCYYHPIVHLLKSGHLHSMYLTDLQVSLLPCKYIRWVGNQTVRNFFWLIFIYLFFSLWINVFSAFFSSCQRKEWKRWLKGIFYFSCLHGYKCSLIWGTQKVFVCFVHENKKTVFLRSSQKLIPLRCSHHQQFQFSFFLNSKPSMKRCTTT